MTSRINLSCRRLSYHGVRRAFFATVAVSILVFAATPPSWGQEAAIPGTASDDSSSSRGHLVYSKLDRGGWQVWETDMAAKTSKRLTTSARDKRNPSVDANGDVVFHTVNQTVYRIRNGVEERILTDLDRLRDVEWNPVDGRLAMVRIRRDVLDMMHVWTAGSASNDKKRETGEPRVEAGGAAKQSDVAPRLLTREPGVQCHPSWSPDGKRLAFVSGHGWGTYELNVMDADGRNRLQLTSNKTHEFCPDWSPDGQWIVYSSDETGDYELWAIRPDGSDRRRLTNTPGIDTHPTWSPDGRSLAFCSNRSGRLGIWMIDVGGGPARPLDVGGEACDPCWVGGNEGDGEVRHGAELVRRQTVAPVAKAWATPSRTNVGPFATNSAITNESRDSSDSDETHDKSSTSRAARSVAPEVVAQLIRGSGVEPKEVDVRTPRPKTTIWCDLVAESELSVDVVDHRGHVVRTFDLGRRAAGRQSVDWDGRDASDAAVEVGVYRYVFRVRRTDREDGEVVVDLSARTGGEEVAPRDFTYDNKTGKLRWVNPKAVFARLRMRLRRFPHLRTLIDWKPLPAGPTEIVWDGKDEQGLVDFSAHPDQLILMNLFALPQATIIVRGEEGVVADQVGRTEGVAKETKAEQADGVASEPGADPRPTYPPLFSKTGVLRPRPLRSRRVSRDRSAGRTHRCEAGRAGSLRRERRRQRPRQSERSRPRPLP